MAQSNEDGGVDNAGYYTRREPKFTYKLSEEQALPEHYFGDSAIYLKAKDGSAYGNYEWEDRTELDWD